MPEGPEVTYLTTMLSKAFTNTILQNINILSGRYENRPPKNFKNLTKSLPSKILKISNKGKFMYIVLENEYTIWITLGLTGMFVLECEGKTRDERGILVDKYCHIQFDTSAKTAKSFFYSDMRNFGTLTITLPKDKANLEKKLNSLGDDPLQAQTPKETKKQIANFVEKVQIKRNQLIPIGSLLLDQKYLAGVGNYIRAIALYRAKISPHRPIKSLSSSDLENIYKEIKKIEQASYKKQLLNGLHTYELDIYRKEKDQLGNPITSDELPKGRHIYWVKKIQK